MPAKITNGQEIPSDEQRVWSMGKLESNRLDVDYDSLTRLNNERSAPSAKARITGKRRIDGKVRPRSMATAPSTINNSDRGDFKISKPPLGADDFSPAVSSTAVSSPAVSSPAMFSPPATVNATSEFPTDSPSQNASKNADEVTVNFAPLVARMEQCVVQFINADGNTILGTVVTADGLIVTKASCVAASGRCVFSNGTSRDYRILATDQEKDLSLIEVVDQATTPVTFTSPTVTKTDNDTPSPGTFVVSVGRNRSVAAWGIVSVSRHRDNNKDSANHTVSDSFEQATDDRWGGGPFSRLRFGFGETLVHDSVLAPNQCGGPLVDLEGKFIGINIARSLRVATLTIFTEDLIQFIRMHRPESNLAFENE